MIEPMRRLLRVLPACALLTTVMSSGPASHAQETVSEACASTGSLSFVCGANQPEDLARLPGTSWIFVSGFSPGSGLKLLDTRTRRLVRWDGRNGDAPEFDVHRFPRCDGPPDAATLNLQGLSLREGPGGVQELLASNHAGREAIEIFRITSTQQASPARPRVQWIGCLPLPAGMAANSVTRFPDGTVLATVLTLPGRTMADFVLGRNSGAVLEWAPGAPGFRKLPGTDLPGPNGIEADPDNRHFYVIAFGRHAVVGFERGRSARKRFESTAPGFMPDNIHWDATQLIAAGMQYDEPACGGLRKVVDGVAEPLTCHRGFTVARLDLSTKTWRILAYDTPNPDFNGVSTGLVLEGRLWLGSFLADRLAYRDLPDAAR